MKTKVPGLLPEFSEKVKYNYSEYPIYVKRDLLSQYPNYSAVSHWHKDVEFILILSGYMIYNVNGKCIRLEKGNGIMVNGHQFHHGFSDECKECEFICIILNPLLLSVNEFFERIYIDPLINNEKLPWIGLSRQVKWQKEILEFIYSIYLKSMEQDPFLELQQMILGLWNVLYYHTRQEEKTAAQKDGSIMIVKKMLTYIHSHYNEKLTLDMIADAGNVCKSKCHTLFRMYLSRTPMEYVTEYRLRKSLDDLLNSSLTIAEIGYSVGINSASYYSELFRKYFHCTPKEYMKRYQKNERQEFYLDSSSVWR